MLRIPYKIKPFATLGKNIVFSFKDALRNAFNGIKYIFRNERNFRIQVFIAILALLIAFFLKLHLLQIGIIVLVIFLVLLTESINTIIEVVVDMYTEEYNEKAKIAKDVSAGAVTLISVCSIIIGIIIYLPPFINFLRSFLYE